jgi:hypothetical protein
MVFQAPARKDDSGRIRMEWGGTVVTHASRRDVKGAEWYYSCRVGIHMLAESGRHWGASLDSLAEAAKPTASTPILETGQAQQSEQAGVHSTWAICWFACTWALAALSCPSSIFTSSHGPLIVTRLNIGPTGFADRQAGNQSNLPPCHSRLRPIHGRATSLAESRVALYILYSLPSTAAR